MDGYLGCFCSVVNKEKEKLLYRRILVDDDGRSYKMGARVRSCADIETRKREPDTGLGHHLRSSF